MKNPLHWLEKKMMYSAAIDSAGVSHSICTQRKEMSCGIACVAMVVHRVRGIRLLESALRSYSQCFYQGPNVKNTGGYDAKKGTEPFNLAIMLKKMAIPCEYRDSGRALSVLPGASMKKPIIGTVCWDAPPMASGGEANAGSHFVLIDSCDAASGMAVICDPFNGLVECDVRGGYTTGTGNKGGFTGEWTIVT